MRPPIASLSSGPMKLRLAVLLLAAPATPAFAVDPPPPVLAGTTAQEGLLPVHVDRRGGRILLSLESTSARMTRLGKSTVTDTPLLTPEEIVKRLEAVTAPEVAELAAALLAPERLSVAGIGPDEARFVDAVQRVNPALLEKAA